jgi:hypothetical protein
LGDGSSTSEGPFTSNDLNFLKSLRISLSDDADDDEEIDQDEDDA